MEDLSDLLAALLEGTDVPSLAAAVIVDGEVHAAGAVGVRKRGDETPVTVNDKYHIGSCTKAMTATLGAILVERGTISWETRVRDIFPDMETHPDYEPVTLKQLLSHTAGLPAFTNPAEDEEELVELIDIYSGSAMYGRLNVVLPAVLSRMPRVPPGGQHLYSNMGYIVAGAMLERLVQVPYEILLVEEYFLPLEISTGGFGAAGTVGQLDEPWGHAPEPFEPEAEADNPIVFSPAGRAHMSILDFAKHAVFHLRGEPKLLRRETLEFLHTPVSETYALGWGVVEREWAQGRLRTRAQTVGRSPVTC